MQRAAMCVAREERGVGTGSNAQAEGSAGEGAE